MANFFTQITDKVKSVLNIGFVGLELPKEANQNGIRFEETWQKGEVGKSSYQSSDH